MKRSVGFFFLYSTLWFLSLVVVAFIFKSDIKRVNNVSCVLKALPLGLLFTLCQTFIEEALFRGWYFLVNRKFKLPKLFYILTSGLVFSCFHLFNSEVNNNINKCIVLFNYFVIGAYFMFLVVSTNSLFPSYGAHFGNNVFTFFIVSSLNSSAPFPSLYQMTINEGAPIVVSTTLLFEVVFSVIPLALAVLRKLKKNRTM